MDVYDRDYFERGIESGKSCYQNYRWIPELTLPMAMVMIDHLGIKRGQTILDYGCAKGFLVKALRMLGRDAWGVDISSYAIGQADPEHCFLLNDDEMRLSRSHFCIAKDVFEHVSEKMLPKVLDWIDAGTMLAVVPLGDGNKYRAPANNMDVTHKTCNPEWWWKALFKRNNWKLKHFTFKIPGIKDSYERHSTAHGFFTLEKG